jgi:predicted RNA-binding protein with PIN domain
VDLAPVAAEVRAAAEAAAALSASLARVAGALVPVAPGPLGGGVASESEAPVRARATERSGKGRARRRARPLAALPPGVFDGTPEAVRHLVADGANLLVVDGYNVARTGWSGLAPEEERRRTVSLLEGVQARSGGEVVVIFDGDDGVVGPAASRSVRVRYSASGQTADDAIRDLLGGAPEGRPVVVVSSDRAVAADARRQGATAISSADFLAAARR